MSGESEDRRDSVHGLAAKLAAARVASGLSQTAASDAANVSRPNLSRYEAGTKTPTLAVLLKLAAAYGVGVADLLPTPKPIAPPPAPRPPARGKHK